VIKNGRKYTLSLTFALLATNAPVICGAEAGAGTNQAEIMRLNERLRQLEGGVR